MTTSHRGRGPTGDLRVAGTLTRAGFTLDVDLVARSGQITTVLGPNGAGKSTLLRIVAGLAALETGEVRLGQAVLDGEDLFVPAHRRPVGVVFQDYRLFPHLSVLDNVAYGLRRQGLGRPGGRAEAASWLDALDLRDLADRRPAAISGGQAQRVALARALASQPAAVLLDEPLAALDARTRVEVRGRLGEHLRMASGPVLLVTHDPLDALVLADHAVVLEAGRVTQAGPPAELAARPASDYVARLMGLTLCAGTLDRSGTGEASVDLDGGGRLVVSLDDTVDPPDPGDRMLVTLRPSAITVHAARPEGTSSRNVWPGTVTRLEQLTDRVRVHLEGAPSTLVDVSAAAVADLSLTPGEPVWLSCKATDTTAYPAAADPAGRHPAGRHPPR